MKKISIFLLTFFFISVFSFADVYNSPVLFKDFVDKIPQIKSINCKFRQEKYLQNISKPIISSGDFKFIENEGVYFYIKEPIQTEIDYTNKNYKQINEIINAISVKKYSRLDKEFDFYFEKNGDNWILGLKPKKQSKAYDYISSVTIYGVDYIQKISINQKNGNKTVIWFIK